MFLQLHHVILVLATCSNILAEEVIDVVEITPAWQAENYTRPDTIWNRFIVQKVVPNIIPIAPKLPLKVKYGNISVDFGNTIAATDIIRAPTQISFPAEKDKFYCLYMTGIRYFPNYRSHLRGIRTTWVNPPKWQWHHWIVANIPAGKVKAGQVLWPYFRIILPINLYTQEYVFLVYEQPRKMRFSKKAKHGKFMDEYLKVHEFARYHGLKDPIYGNFFKQGPAVGNHSLSENPAYDPNDWTTTTNATAS